MALQVGFANCWTSGEIAPEAWDRVDLQPVQKGCEQALNLVPMIQGPLAKRRGFWRAGANIDPALNTRLIPFVRSVDDALILEFGDSVAHAWSPNGAPLLDGGGAPVSFATGFPAALLPGLRFKQIGDVLYIFHASGTVAPRSISRYSNTDWRLAALDFPNGPWLPENNDDAKTLTIGGLHPELVPGDYINVTPTTGVGLDDSWIGEHVRLRAPSGASTGLTSWAPATAYALNQWVLCNGRIYANRSGAAVKTGLTPPVHEKGSSSDGAVVWEYMSDGAGVIQITSNAGGGVYDALVVSTLPFYSGVATAAYAEAAYSDRNGWPSAWPAMREERLVTGAAGTNQDYVDLTQTAGFTPTKLDYHPNLGTGAVIDTDGVRRRMGDDGAGIAWFSVATYLVAATRTGEFLIAGSVLDEPISPAAVVIKQLSAFGGEPILPVRAHDALLYVQEGAHALRELRVDQNQQASNRDLTVLAGHVGRRGLAQIVWCRQDDVAWIRTADGGLVAYAYHVEEQVQGFTTQALPAGWIVEDMAVIPGEAKFDTLWLRVMRQKGGVTQRELWFLSGINDGNFLDAADVYSGAPVTQITNLGHREGETLRVVADGIEVGDLPVAGGVLTLPKPASDVRLGTAVGISFKSLRLDMAGSLNLKQRIIETLVSLNAVVARVGLFGGLMQKVLHRLRADNPAAVVRRGVTTVTVGADSETDPRISVTDDSASDLQILSLKTKVAVGAG